MTNDRRLWQWFGWTFALAMLTVAMLAVRSHLDKAHVSLVFLLVVLGASAGSGRTLGLVMAGLSFLIFNFFFLPPYYTLVIANPLDWLVLVSFLITAAVAAQLLYRANNTAGLMAQRANEVDRLATLGAETLNAGRAEDALLAIVNVIRTSLGVDVCEVLVRDSHAPDGTAHVRRVARSVAQQNEAEMLSAHFGADSLAEWVLQQDQSAVEFVDGTVRVLPELPRRTSEPVTALNAGTMLVQATALRNDGGPETRALAVSLRIRDQSVGMLRIAARDSFSLSPEQARFLSALAYYAALGVERMRLVSEAEQAEAERKAEGLRSSLLTAVSHDLRTPLTTIKGIAHEVARGGSRSDAELIVAEVDHLDAMIGAMLDLSRINAGSVSPVLAVNTVDDLIGAALQRAAGILGQRSVNVRMSGHELLTGRFDLAQSLRVLVNLLDNAARYSPMGAPIDIEAERRGDKLLIRVLDRGAGVAPGERERIFEQFYRSTGVAPEVRGTGLGLSIARGLAEAQGGTLRYAEREGGGSALILELPAVNTNPVS